VNDEGTQRVVTPRPAMICNRIGAATGSGRAGTPAESGEGAIISGPLKGNDQIGPNLICRH
jgi:hypothetical protein